jgi:hypothetical protein
MKIFQFLSLAIRWKIGGSLLILIFGILSLMGPAFTRETPLIDRPIITMTTMMVLAGLVFLYLAGLTLHSRSGKRLLIWILITGAMMRIFMLFTTPMLEDDYFRYLWDGAVTAHGLNPYQYSPDQITRGFEEPSNIPPVLLELAGESGAIIENINHSYLRTIYPPVTQAAFALAYLIQPWSLLSWKIVLLLFDAATLLLLFYILRYLNISSLWVGIYWLNPLLVKEIFNSGHMDLLIFPFLLSALILSIRRKPFLAATALVLAMGTKLWPVALLPLIIRPLFQDYKRMAAGLCWFILLCILMFLPVFASGLDPNSGFNAYSQRWQLNDSLFKLFIGMGWGITRIIGIHPGFSQLIARLLTALTLVGWVAYITLQKTNEPQRVFDQALLIVAAMFLLLPNQFPWYVVWLIPFLAISPRRPLLLLNLLLPLYYLRYYFLTINKVEFFDYGIVWLEFVPVWILILREWRIHRKFKITSPLEVSTNHER